MFETNLRDERFLPFEGAGAESTWKLDLPKSFRGFDYQSISDVILHVRYTARQGVELSKVTGALGDLFKQLPKSNLATLFSLRHEFASEWSRFANGVGDFSVQIRRDFFPYFVHDQAMNITGIDLYDGNDVSKHRAIAVPATASEDLNDKNELVLSVAADTQVARLTSDRR
jgi:hypothetical protein